jgi:hypothetical protein
MGDVPEEHIGLAEVRLARELLVTEWDRLAGADHCGRTALALDRATYDRKTAARVLHVMVDLVFSARRGDKSLWNALDEMERVATAATRKCDGCGKTLPATELICRLLRPEDWRDNRPVPLDVREAESFGFGMGWLCPACRESSGQRGDV